ncbi:MAG: hypothetical protein U5K51_10015 [Flavobacteriaceae bacterium]|nr:hypothetical protein [Flavobacteriaceae bacterium]
MKNILLIAFIGFINLVYTQNSGVAEYLFMFQKFEDDAKDAIEKDARVMVELTAEYAKAHKYILKFNPEESYYFVEETLPLENSDSFTYKFSTMIFSNGIFYQNIKTRE